MAGIFASRQGLRRNHVRQGREDGSLLDGHLQDKTHGTDLLPDLADHSENAFPVLSHKLQLGTMKIKLVKKET